MDTNVLDRSCCKFHLKKKKMRKPSLPGAARMLIYRGLGPCQSLHVDGSGAVLLSGAEQKLSAPGSCSVLPPNSVGKEKHPMFACLYMTCASSRAGLWTAPGESLTVSWDASGPWCSGLPPRAGYRLWPPPSCPSSGRAFVVRPSSETTPLMLQELGRSPRHHGTPEQVLGRA